MSYGHDDDHDAWIDGARWCCRSGPSTFCLLEITKLASTSRRRADLGGLLGKKLRRGGRKGADRRLVGPVCLVIRRYPERLLLRFWK